jgi:hypothetical protein
MSTIMFKPNNPSPTNFIQKKEHRIASFVYQTCMLTSSSNVVGLPPNYQANPAPSCAFLRLKLISLVFP